MGAVPGTLQLGPSAHSGRLHALPEWIPSTCPSPPSTGRSLQPLPAFGQMSGLAWCAVVSLRPLCLLLLPLPSWHGSHLLTASADALVWLGASPPSPVTRL
jgi:hypothetical protein